MRAVVQRVTHAKVIVNGVVVGQIGTGLLVLLGVAVSDTQKDADYLAHKTVSLRVFNDSEEQMNLSIRDVNGDVLVVSQFTLYGDLRRGLRPSWIEAAQPEHAQPLYDHFVTRVKESLGRVATGSFRQTMQVELINDGPVTILLDSRKLF
jgi:D-aminoacyl-tRNA deacylase